MNDNNSEYQELISALADGKIDDKDFTRTLSWMADNPQSLIDWSAYHLVGDVMRFGERASVGSGHEKLLAAIRGRLSSNFPQEDLNQVMNQNKFELRPHESANQANFHWKVVAGLASLMAVAVLGWQLWISPNIDSSANQLARNEANSLQPELPLMIRSPELDKLLEDHRHNGGISAFQLPAGFMRNATFDRSSR